MKKVSIVMPVYNGEEYIKESIQSIIDQSYTDWELIIVNEYGSDDDSVSIIKEFMKRDNRIILIQNDKREGIAESLNIGLRKATGDYIARMDSDDLSGVDRLKKQVTYLEKHKNIGLCGIQPEFFGTEKISWELEKDPIQIRNNIFFYTPCVHPTIMFRRELIDKYKLFYNKDYKATEDYEFFSRVVGVTDIANIDDKTLFKYRMYANNATNRNNNIGIKLYSEVMRNCFEQYLNLTFTDEEIDLLDSHISIKNKSDKELYDAVVRLDILLKKILLKSKNNKQFETESLFKSLRKRWQELRWSIKEENKNSAIDFLIDKSIFNRDSFNINNKFDLRKADITVLMPVYNSEKYILDSVLSLLDQTYKNFIIYIMIEKDNSDQTEEYLSLLPDNRIRLMHNEEKLGLANTLNEGIKKTKTEFIARMDSDDISIENRLEKERDFLLNNKDVALVSTWQRHFGDFGTYIHSSESSSEDLAASLLFKCDICHSTVMFRTQVMKDNEYYYNPNMAMEDFDLWNRMVVKEKLYCIPEVLGEYRIHGENITQAKHQKVIESEQKIISRSLERLGIKKSSYDQRLLIGWDNIYYDNPKLVDKAIELFKRIINNNKKYNVYNEDSLKKAIKKRLSWMKGEDAYIEKEAYVSTPKGGSLRGLVKKIVKPFIMPVYSRLISRIEYRIDERSNYIRNDYDTKISNISSKMEEKDILLESECQEKIEHISSDIVKIKKDYKDIHNSIVSEINSLKTVNEDNINNINSKIASLETVNEDNMSNINSKIDNLANLFSEIQDYINSKKPIEYTRYNGGKIRIAIIFQVASFWPSIESVYEKLKNDERFELMFFLLDQKHMEPSQMNSAEDFLKINKISYELLTISKLKEFNPYIAIVQTPYDKWHRSDEFSSANLTKMGIRLAYIPYGIELGGSQESLKYQYNDEFFNNMWRIYTLSEVTQKYFCIYSKQTIDGVKAYGHPKFDGLVNKRSTTNYNFKKMANGKKIVLVKIHFPIVFNNYVVTPDLQSYIDLLDHIDEYKNIYFIFMLHPLLFDDNKNKMGKQLVEKVMNTKNIYVFKDEDYREPLFAADAFICDRSSLAIEIGTFNKPILFMENANHREILIQEFDELFAAYEKGTSYKDINAFLQNIDKKDNINNIDYKLQFQKCVHFYDGKAAERIVDDLYNSLICEKKEESEKWKNIRLV